MAVFQNVKQIHLTSSEMEVLESMFSQHERVVIKDEFLGGFGGVHVLWIRPIATNGAELPVVAKLGSIEIIKKEWDAFQQFVAKKVPNIARLYGELALSKNGEYAGICYPMAGDGRFYAESLASFAAHAPTRIVTYVLQNHLFASMEAMWQDNSLYPEAPVAASFDPILPANILVEATPKESTTPLAVSPQSLQQQQHYRGVDIRLTGFIVEEIDVYKNELTLNVPQGNDRLPKSFRIRVTAVSDPTPFTTGNPLPFPISGIIQDTRETYLQQWVTRLFTDINAAATPIKLPDLEPLPNPLAQLNNLLTQTRDVYIGPIHGDLNLQNILVEYDEQSQHIFLIDFAAAREDIVLHDLWRLETGIWLYLVPPLLQQAGLTLTEIPALNQAVHTAVSTANQPTFNPALEKAFYILTTVRRQANQYFVQKNKWSEYYNGLIPYLLGALKFKNLDHVPTAPLPKQIAFITAASLLQITQERPKIMFAPPTTDAAPTSIPQTAVSQPGYAAQTTAAAPTGTTLTADPQTLHPLLVEHFTLADMEEMCFKLNIEPEDIPGKGRSAKAREFIMHLKRHGRLEELPPLMQAMRPRVNWQ
ncbi:MAG: phosphotransferase [Anaerolineales bacterium]|nr:phosphotransferase [Anaerolineales bacterium]